jgi:succinyl-CoA synthetase beta subunit
VRLFEFEAKKLFKIADIAVPESVLVDSPASASEAAEKIGGPVILKAQVLTGGRGKAGGIKPASSGEEAARLGSELFSLKIKGFPVERALVEPQVEHSQELYLGVTIDRMQYKLVVIASASGGVDIEEVAASTPEKIYKEFIGIDEVLTMERAAELAQKCGLSGATAEAAADTILKLVDLFRKHEAKLVEINPLAVLPDGGIIALDGRMSIDEDSLFRHPEINELGVEHRHEEGEMTPREKEATEAGIPYLDLDGDIGMFPGGAGFGIMGNDLITDLGGKPANFMDSGGGPSPERISKMLSLLNNNPQVKAIFGARFGGVSRCDDFAKGVIMFLENEGLNKPMAMRMTGNMWQEGVRIFDEAKKSNPELFKNIEAYGIETAIEVVARRAVDLAKEAAAGKEVS